MVSEPDFFQLVDAVVVVRTVALGCRGGPWVLPCVSSIGTREVPADRRGTVIHGFAQDLALQMETRLSPGCLLAREVTCPSKAFRDR